MVNAIAKLNDQIGALLAARRLVAAGLQLLSDNAGITLELEAPASGHSADRDDVEGLALWRGHRLVTRHGGVERFRAGRKSKRAERERRYGGRFQDTHRYTPSSREKSNNGSAIARFAVNRR